MTKSIINIKILDELRNFIVSLTKEEYTQLEKSLLEDGCRDSLVVWDYKSEYILVDGHNRYKICTDNNIEFDISVVNFEHLEDVKLWMLNNQMGRRNLSPDQLSYYRGLKYISLRNKKGGYDNVLSKGQNELSTSDLLALEFKISASTVKRDAKFAEGLVIIANSNPILRNRILKGDVKVKKSDIQILTHSKNQNSIVIKNEADLFNKAKEIRDSLLNDVEFRIDQIDRSNQEASVESLDHDLMKTMFMPKNDRIQTIKGRIISAINRAINNKDFEAIVEMKKQIDKLEVILFDN